MSGRVLITGATGFIGRHALAPLRELGFEVHASARRLPPEPNGDVIWHAADLLAPGAPQRLVAAAAPTHLLHLAWNTEPGRYWTTPENLAWTEATLALHRAFADAGGVRAVHAGTCAEYDWTYGMCSEHSTPLQPSTLYGASKQAAGAAVTAYGAAHGPPTAWGRVFFLYGPGEHPQRLLPSVIGALLERRPVGVTHGRQVRDFMHVADVAGAFAALVAREDVQGPVNIASGEPVSLRELIGLVSARLDGGDLVRFGERPTPPGEPPVLLADTRRLREAAGFSSRFDLESGLDDAIAWWRTQA